MKDFGEILLISCYELGHQPMGIAMPAGFLERAGYHPDLLDLSLERLDHQKISRARFIGISVPMHTALRLGIQVAGEIRKINPHVHLCFFGLYASLNTGYLLDHGADSTIGGEFEFPLVNLVNALSTHRLIQIEGVSSKNRISAPYLKRLSFGLPSRRSLPPLHRYAAVEQNGKRQTVGYVETSRGCRHLCLHCPITPVYEGRFFIIPQEVVLDDIRKLAQEGAVHITFGDPDFLNAPKHAVQIAKEMRKKFPDMTFDFTAKVEHILKNKELFREFASCGCIFMISAIESFSSEVLGHLKKGHSREDITMALSILNEAGITLRPSLVSFTPWTSLKDYLFMLDFVENNGLIDTIDPVQYTIRLLVPPGSALLSEPSIQPYLGPLAEESFTYRWNHPDPRMDDLQKSVSKLVEAGTQNEEDPETLFYRIQELAYALYERRAPRAVQHTPDLNRKKPPRLTEPWFCCAEPTESQLEVFQEPQV
ncbi:MAG: CUAEP/CCAEP-tail radical SAM (seleno)protein [Nitrospiria bacterium]